MSKSEASPRQSARAIVDGIRSDAASAMPAAILTLRGAPIVLLLILLRRSPALQIRSRRHADNVEAGIDEENFAGGSAREVRKQIQCRAADMVKFDGALEGRVVLVPLVDHAGIAHRAAGQGAHGPCRDGVDANAVLAEIG